MLESFGPLIQFISCISRQKDGSSARRDYDNARAPPFGILRYSAQRTSLSQPWGTMNLENAASRVLNFIPNRTNAAPATVSS